ncbi:hypothetical protein Tco_0689498 [Tanacetum coccineum]
MSVDDLLQLVPQLMTRVDSLEKDLKQTKLTIGVLLIIGPKRVRSWKGEEQVEDISPNTLEAAKTLSRVASQKPKSIDLRERSNKEERDKGKEGVNTGSIKVSTVSGQVSTDIINKSIPSPDKGQREGKAPMIIEEAPKKTKNKILTEEAIL